jgi:hypothetical protein
MPRAEDCRLRATEAAERAKEATDVEAKRIFLEAARQWRDVAELMEQERLPGSPNANNRWL